MRKLLEALASWEGPARVGEEIAKRGFFVPQSYRSEMVAYCGSCGIASDLETYWSESSKEYVFSGGRADSRRRRIPDEAPYRSLYLDQLESQWGPITSGMNQLHPCLTRWVDENHRTHSQLGRELSDRLELVKDEERKQQGFSDDGWTGKKKDVKPILRYYAEQEGFEERRLADRGFAESGKAFCKETSSGLIFHCWVDTGGLPDTSLRLPTNFFVSHKEDTFRPLGAGADSIYMGAGYYDVFRRTPNATFGVFALVKIFDAFFSTFS